MGAQSEWAGPGHCPGLPELWGACLILPCIVFLSPTQVSYPRDPEGRACSMWDSDQGHQPLPHRGYIVPLLGTPPATSGPQGAAGWPHTRCPGP